MAQHVINTASGYINDNGSSANSSYTSITFERKSSTTMGGYLTFDTSAIPSSAKNISVVATATLNIQSDYGKGSNGSWTQCGARLTSGTINKGDAGELSAKTTDTNLEFDGGSFTREELEDLRFKVIYTTNGYGSQDTAAVLSIKNLVVTITYERGITYNVEVTTGDNIDVDKASEAVGEGDSFTVTITPQSGVTISSATDNGTDILNLLEEKHPATGGTITKYPASYSTSGTSINGTRYRNCIGKGSSTTASGNDYASGNSSSQSVITYTFDFSDIPEDAIIKSVTVTVGGHAENTSRSVANLQLYSGNTAKGSQSKFSSTSKQVVTMTPGTWTRTELQEAQLRFTIGYYGGLINGVDFIVEYDIPTTEVYYVYTISSVAEAHTILINVGGKSITLYSKGSSGYSILFTGKTLYKKINGVWVVQDSLSSAIDSSSKYIHQAR